MSHRFAENFYSFRASATLVGIQAGDTPPDAATLAAIEAALLTANKQFWAGRYQDAIASYNSVAAQIYGFIDPGYPKYRPAQSLKPDLKLFKPILSASLEYLNLLPPHVPDPGPVSRLAVDPSLLAPMALADAAGVRSNAMLKAGTQEAFKKWQLAQTYAGGGMTQTGIHFEAAARSADRHLVDAIESGSRRAVQTTDAPHTSGQGRLASTALQSVRSGIADIPSGLGSGAGTALAHLPSSFVEGRTFSTVVDGKVRTMTWAAGEGPSVKEATDGIYTARTTLKVLPDVLMRPTVPAEFAVSLPHILYYTIPLGLAECYQALGDYSTAESHFFDAANYPFLNTAIEAPYVWLRLAQLYLAWGNAGYLDGDPAAALAAYTQVIAADGSVPTTPLYKTAAFSATATVAASIIAAIGDVTKLPDTINPQLIAVVLEIHQQLIKLNAGLDYWGHTSNYVPIWTFAYLQSVAVNFAQLAMGAERDFINYQQQSDAASLTRTQLQQAVSQSQAEIGVAAAQAAAAHTEADAYQQGVNLAALRASDAQTARNDYQNSSWGTIQYQAESTANSGGDDGDVNQINADADALLSGHDFSDSHGTAAAASSLAAAKLNRDYELGSMQRDITEMNAAQAQAQAELDAANARAAADDVATSVATLRADNAQQMLDAFEAQTFTPDVWRAMANVVFSLYQRYFNMALKAAKLMQIAYNFETDQSLHFIRNSYAGVEVMGLLGADQLMADIQSFTYDLITSKAGKPQPIKQTISLAERYPYAFETQFRKTGAMDFQTRIEDFDEFFPGTFAGRIEAVEVNVDGLVPVAGISGTLTNGGISMYRVPDWNPAAGTGLKYRIQNSETLALSDYDARNDALLISADQRMLRVFEGAGVSSSWRLDLPPAVNDIDYGAVIDVRLTFYYKARFDPDLKVKVLTHLAALPGADKRTCGLPLRWLYPDAFFHFIDTGVLQFTLRSKDFRRNQTQPKITNVALVVTTDGSVLKSGITLALATPAHPAAVSQKTDADGTATSGAAASAFNALAAGSALGDYTVTIAAADNPGLVSGGKLALDSIANIALIIEYQFTPKA